MPTPGPIDFLLGRLERAGTWPFPGESRVRELVHRWAAFRDTDDGYLRDLARWPTDRAYYPDPLAEKIAGAYGSLLWGEDPTARPANEADVELLTGLMAHWPSSLQSAEETCVSEGEVWWRLSANPLASSRVCLSWHTRTDVVPLLHGRDAMAVAFVSFLGPSRPDEEIATSSTPDRVAWRALEVHQKGRVETVLYRGSWRRLGERQDLAAHPDLEGIEPVWEHGLPMLAGRIVNKWGRRPTLGVSEYAGVWKLLLILNEATTIGRENMRLTAKKRAVVPASSIRPTTGASPGQLPTANGPDDRPRAPRWDAGEDVLIHDPLDTDDGKANVPFRILEYSFDAQALIAYQRHVAETILARCDIVPQWIGAGDFGQAESGTALRVRLLPTTNAAESKARPWDDELPRIAMLAQLLEALPTTEGGLGIPWTAPSEVPSIERADPLPQDPNENADRLERLRRAELVSIRTGVKDLHPDWTDDLIDAEVDAIRSDAAATVSGVFGGSLGP